MKFNEWSKGSDGKQFNVTTWQKQPSNVNIEDRREYHLKHNISGSLEARR